MRAISASKYDNLEAQFAFLLREINKEGEINND